MEVIGHLHVKPPVPTEQEAGWASEPIWMKEEYLAEPGLERGMSRQPPSEPCVFIEPVSQKVRHRVETFQIRQSCRDVSNQTSEEWLNEFSGMWWCGVLLKLVDPSRILLKSHSKQQGTSHENRLRSH